MVVQQGSEGTVTLERPRVRTSDVLSDNAKSFEDLLLSPALISSLKLSGFTQPSPVQQSAIPLGRIGSDLIVQAKSGTGKTVAFAVICLLRVKVAVTLPQVGWMWCPPASLSSPVPWASCQPNQVSSRFPRLHYFGLHTWYAHCMTHSQTQDQAKTGQNICNPVRVYCGNVQKEYLGISPLVCPSVPQMYETQYGTDTDALYI